MGVTRTAQEKIEPFYFTSYDRVIGVAGNVKQLDIEMKRLLREDRACLEYHLGSGNIVKWLQYADEPDLAMELTGVVNGDQAVVLIEKHIARAIVFHRMKRGRMH